MNLDPLIEAIAERVAERVLQRLQAPAPADVYTSRTLPPDCPSRARFNLLAKSVPGAVKHGRTWTVPRAAWEAFRRKGTPVVETNADRIADAALAAAGFRGTR